jgi:aspartyl-tRNA(Asn)/glutamyl-tRNA(Gln) amidotransferase subunit A
MSAPIHALSATALGEALARCEITARAATQAYLDRIARLNPQIKAFTQVDAEGALRAADEADARLARGQGLGPLDGVPIAVKDNIAVAGLACTSGVEGRRNSVAAEDAFCVTLLREHGCVILGTLNMHEGALGATTDNQAYGRCENPWRAGYTPGGSSGGSGAAVAAGLCAAALGTDTMGSVRIPASYCGVFGFKPSYGRISSDGLSHLSWTLDHIGPIVRHAQDLRLLMSVLATGHAGALVTRPSDDYRDFWLDEPVRFADLRIGVLDVDVMVEPGVLSAFQAAVAKLEAFGATVEPFKPATPGPDILRRRGLLISEAEGAVAFASELETGGISADFRALLEYGARQPAAKLASAHYDILTARAAIRKQMAYQGLDLLVSPTAPQTAFVHGARAPASQADFTALGNIADLPAASAPIGLTDGLPVGLQVLGGEGADAFVLRAVIALERIFAPQTLAIAD